MNISDSALTIFVTTEMINMTALLADFILKKNDLPSITYVSTTYPVIGVGILLFQTISPISLGAHFWFYKN